MTLGEWWRSVRYGNELVGKPAATSIFVDVAGPDLMERGHVEHDRKFVVEVTSDIHHVVHLVPLKGNSCCIAWGASLSFVPHSWKSQVRWHRTMKSARLDLFEAPAMSGELPIDDLHTLTANGLHGEALFRKELAELWGRQRDIALGWLSRVSTLEGVIQESIAQANDPDNFHDPPPSLIAAFALARSGAADDARQYLQRALGAHGPTLEPHYRLCGAFEQVLEEHRA